jgi:hypothetical protein
LIDHDLAGDLQILHGDGKSHEENENETAPQFWKVLDLVPTAVESHHVHDLTAVESYHVFYHQLNEKVPGNYQYHF